MNESRINNTYSMEEKIKRKDGREVEVGNMQYKPNPE